MTDYSWNQYRREFDLSVCSARAGKHLDSRNGIPDYTDNDVPAVMAEMAIALRRYADGENGERARQALQVFENFCNVGGERCS